LQLDWNECVEHERNNICSEKRAFAVSMRGRKPGELQRGQIVNKVHPGIQSRPSWDPCHLRPPRGGSKPLQKKKSELSSQHARRRRLEGIVGAPAPMRCKPLERLFCRHEHGRTETFSSACATFETHYRSFPRLTVQSPHQRAREIFCWGRPCKLARLK
jgi:hypothetical protein